MRHTRTILTATAALVLCVGVPAQAESTTATVHRFTDGTQVEEAWSQLRTGDEGAHFILHTSDLEPGHTVTVWYVIFNNPTECSHPEGPLRCGPGDLPPFGGDDSAETSVVYAAGHQVGTSGPTSFAGSLQTGDTDGSLWGPGLTNPLRADIHLVVRDHGRLAPQQRAAGIHDFGTCSPDCVDVQFSAHEPARP